MERLNGDEFLREFVKDYYRHPNQPVIQPNTRGMRALADYSVERIGRAEDRIAELETELQAIHSWCEAYPLEVFPKPDLKRARELLGDAEFTRLNAHSMRHVVEGFKARAALAAPSGVKPHTGFPYHGTENQTL